MKMMVVEQGGKVLLDLQEHLRHQLIFYLLVVLVADHIQIRLENLEHLAAADLVTVLLEMLLFLEVNQIQQRLDLERYTHILAEMVGLEILTGVMLVVAAVLVVVVPLLHRLRLDMVVPEYNFL